CVFDPTFRRAAQQRIAGGRPTADGQVEVLRQPRLRAVKIRKLPIRGNGPTSRPAPSELTRSAPAAPLPSMGHCLTGSSGTVGSTPPHAATARPHGRDARPATTDAEQPNRCSEPQHLAEPRSLAAPYQPRQLGQRGYDD